MGVIVSADEVSDERLAKQSPPELSNFGPEAIERAARLAYLLNREEHRRIGSKTLPPWEALSEQTRAISCRGTLRVLQAMTMLGWIEPP